MRSAARQPAVPRQRLLLLALVTMTLVACNRVQLVYNQLDWLLPYYLETYVELSAEQDSYLEQQVGELLAWHCSTQLAAYADLLRAAGDDFSSGAMTRERLAGYSGQIEQYWRNILLQSTPAMTGLLQHASDAQIEELYASFDERNREWLEEFNERTEDELRDDYVERMERELERWYGPLEPDQRRHVQAWGTHFRPLGTSGLQMRKAWQARLRDLLQRREQQDEFRAGMYALINEARSFQPETYRQAMEHNHELTLTLVYTVGKTLTPQQRAHLDQRAESIAQDFENLACEDDPAQPLVGSTDQPSATRQGG
jgi:hypothetical protein